MKVSFVVFSEDVSETKELYKINNAEIKFGIKKIATRATLDVDTKLFLSFVLENRVLWKYRMYDMNNRRRNVWLIRKKDYEQIKNGVKYDNK